MAAALNSESYYAVMKCTGRTFWKQKAVYGREWIWSYIYITWWNKKTDLRDGREGALLSLHKDYQHKMIWNVLKCSQILEIVCLYATILLWWPTMDRTTINLRIQVAWRNKILAHTKLSLKRDYNYIMGSLFRPSLLWESQTQNTMNLQGGGGRGHFYNIAYQMLVIASSTGHFTPSHLTCCKSSDSLGWSPHIKVNKQQKHSVGLAYFGVPKH